MPKLDSVAIEGYKSIKSLKDFELKSLNVLIGANGSGKSNFIGLFDLLHQIVSKNLQLTIGKSGGPDSFLFLGQKVTEEINVKLLFGNNGYQCRLVAADGDALIFSEENVFYHKKKDYLTPFVKGIGTGHKESKLKDSSEQGDRICRYVLGAMESWRVYHFHDTSTSSKMKQIGELGDNLFLRPNASNLSAFLFMLREAHKEYYDNIVDTIRMVAPFFIDFALRPNPLNKEKIKLEWKEKGSDAYFDAHSLSDGTLRFICLTTLLLQPKMPSTILLDEPELGLHPYAITVLAELLSSASTKTQVIVSTQSVTLVNQFTAEDIIIVDRKKEESIFERPSLKEIESWLDDYGLGELWEKNIIGGRPSQ